MDVEFGRRTQILHDVMNDQHGEQLVHCEMVRKAPRAFIAQIFAKRAHLLDQEKAQRDVFLLAHRRFIFQIDELTPRRPVEETFGALRQLHRIGLYPGQDAGSSLGIGLFLPARGVGGSGRRFHAPFASSGTEFSAGARDRGAFQE